MVSRMVVTAGLESWQCFLQLLTNSASAENEDSKGVNAFDALCAQHLLPLINRPGAS